MVSAFTVGSGLLWREPEGLAAPREGARACCHGSSFTLKAELCEEAFEEKQHVLFFGEVVYFNVFNESNAIFIVTPDD